MNDSCHFKAIIYFYYFVTGLQDANGFSLYKMIKSILLTTLSKALQAARNAPANSAPLKTFGPGPCISLKLA